jgi:hypothetical protein
MLVALLVLAAVLELAGLSLAAVGFMRTWREHAPGQDFWQPQKARARSARERAWRRFQQMIGKPATQHAVLGAAQINVNASAFNARGRVTWGPLPDPADLPALVAELRRRINELHAALQQARFDLDDERTARETDEEEPVRRCARKSKPRCDQLSVSRSAGFASRLPAGPWPGSWSAPSRASARRSLHRTAQPTEPQNPRNCSVPPGPSTRSLG